MSEQPNWDNAGQAGNIECERDGVVVRFIVNCKSEYDAMMLYDRMTEEMQNGYVKFEIMTKPILRVDGEG